MTIRTRFTLLFALISGIILLFFSLAIYYLSEDYRQADFQSRLQDRAVSKLKLTLVTENSNGRVDIRNRNDSQGSSYLNEKMVIFNEREDVIYRDSQSMLPGREVMRAVIGNQTYTGTRGEREYVGFSYRYNGSVYYVFASAYDEYGRRYVNNLKRILTFRGLIIMLIIVLSGWLYAGRFLKPISKIVEQADKINYNNLYYRLSSVNSSDEIGRLTATFNKMLDRLETSFKIQKRFVSNASHELRNPLTAISGQIDVALMKKREPDAYEAVLTSVSKEIKNVKNLANNLLELANSEVETLFQDMDEVRVDEILWSVRDELLMLNPDYTIQIHFDQIMDMESHLICKGKDSLLKIAFQNIMENACKFSPDKTAIVNVRSEKSMTLLFFADKGIGMPDTYLKHIFEPFFRGSNTHGIPGNGIGLSLVYRIVRLHSGEIHVQSRINEGTTVTVSLPNLS